MPHVSSQLVCVILLILIGLAFPIAQAHEGHDHEVESVSTTSIETPRLTYSSARLEAVALIDAKGLSIWVDDYASNRPLAHLEISVRSGTRLLRAQEIEPGLYRVARDLLGADGSKLTFTLRGSGFEESFSGALPLPPIDAAHGARSDIILWIGALLLAALILLLLVRARRRA